MYRHSTNCQNDHVCNMVSERTSRFWIPIPRTSTNGSAGADDGSARSTWTDI